MTGRDLIIYILRNGLENEPVCRDGKFLGFLTIDEAAVKLNVGVETVKTWCDPSVNVLEHVVVGDQIYILDNIPDWNELKSGLLD